MINTPKWVDVEVEGEQSKQKYFGRFKLKPYLNHAERADAIRMAERYSVGIVDNKEQRQFLATLAFLGMHITETDAKWWVNSGLDLIDESPIWAIVNKLSEVQDPDFGKPKDEESNK